MEAWIGVYIASVALAIKCCRGEIRCYCNDASCINKGYMCKSSLDQCFSLITPDGATNFRSFHGCAELLSGRLATACGQQEVDYVEHEATGSAGLDRFRSRIVCCAEDMCNYNADGHVFPVPFAPTKGSDGRMQAHKTASDRKGPERRHPARQGQHSMVHEDTLGRDVWFRAAVIAVPIAGLVILVLLILLAVRLLRAEHVIKSSTYNSSPIILKSTNCARVSVAIANESGGVRTVLAPSGESDCAKLTPSSECNRTKCRTDKQCNFKVDTANRRTSEKVPPSSDCSAWDLNCDCCSIVASEVALTKNSNDVLV